MNLKQQADIPVGSVTVHAWVMMPRRQVTGVHAEGESDRSSFQLHVLRAGKDGSGVGGAVINDVTKSRCPDQMRPWGGGVRSTDDTRVPPKTHPTWADLGLMSLRARGRPPSDTQSLLDAGRKWAST